MQGQFKSQGPVGECDPILALCELGKGDFKLASLVSGPVVNAPRLQDASRNRNRLRRKVRPSRQRFGANRLATVKSKSLSRNDRHRIRSLGLTSRDQSLL